MKTIKTIINNQSLEIECTEKLYEQIRVACSIPQTQTISDDMVIQYFVNELRTAMNSLNAK